MSLTKNKSSIFIWPVYLFLCCNLSWLSASAQTCPNQTGTTMTACSGSSQKSSCRCMRITKIGTPPSTPIYYPLPANGQCTNIGTYICSPSVVSPGEECEAAKGLAVAPSCVPEATCQNAGVTIHPVPAVPYTNAQGKPCCDVRKDQTCKVKPTPPVTNPPVKKPACIADPITGEMLE